LWGVAAVLSAGQTARYRNHGDAAPVVLLSGKENRFTRLVETASLLGTSLGQFASVGLREKQRDISALSHRSRSRKEEQWKRSDHWKGGYFYTASGIMGSPLLPPIPKLCRKCLIFLSTFAAQLHPLSTFVALSFICLTRFISSIPAC
ncbi:hypothetical protein AMECASPLE_037691, partial [Ameca splendens]